MFIPFDETILRLPSCLTVHAQLRSNLTKFTSEEYVKFTQRLHVCGIIKKTESETTVLALAVYRTFLTTFDTVRFEIDDIVVDEKERNHGLGTRLFHHLIEQAKQYGVTQILVHCDAINTNAHRFFFHLGLTVFAFEFYLNDHSFRTSNDQIGVIDITELPEKENEELLIQAYDVYRQLRPHLPNDQKAYIKQIQDICRTGPARMLVAVDRNNKHEILGLTTYRVTENVQYGKHIYCDDIVTNEKNRSSGVGRCLVNYMKNQGKDLGINQLTLDSGCQRGRAHRFYYREGFIINQLSFSMTI